MFLIDGHLPNRSCTEVYIVHLGIGTGAKIVFLSVRRIVSPFPGRITKSSILPFFAPVNQYLN